MFVHFYVHVSTLCICKYSSVCVCVCELPYAAGDFHYVCKLLARIIVDEMSTSGRVAKPAGDVNRLFTGL